MSDRIIEELKRDSKKFSEAAKNDHTRKLIQDTARIKGKLKETIKRELRIMK